MVRASLIRIVMRLLLGRGSYVSDMYEYWHEELTRPLLRASGHQIDVNKGQVSSVTVNLTPPSWQQSHDSSN